MEVTGTGPSAPAAPDDTPIEPPVDKGDELRSSLEEHIADKKGAVVLLAVGSKGSGKTHFCVRFLRHSLESGAIDKLFMIAPTAQYEASDSYKWADPKRVFIVEQYSPALIWHLRHRRDKGEEVSRVALFIDDLVAADGSTIWKDQNFAELVAVARHVRVNIVLAHHAVTGGHSLPTFVRQNLSHCLLTRIASKKLLEQCFDEWLGLNRAWRSFREFCPWMTRITEAGPGSGLLVDVSGKLPGAVSWSVKGWWPECAPDAPPRALPPPEKPVPAPKPKPADGADGAPDPKRPRAEATLQRAVQ